MTHSCISLPLSKLNIIVDQIMIVSLLLSHQVIFASELLSEFANWILWGHIIFCFIPRKRTIYLLILLVQVSIVVGPKYFALFCRQLPYGCPIRNWCMIVKDKWMHSFWHNWDTVTLLLNCANCRWQRFSPSKEFPCAAFGLVRKADELCELSNFYY